jgi:hypothetical protein
LSGIAAILLFAVVIIVAIIIFQRRNKKKEVKEDAMVVTISRESSLEKGMQELQNIQIKELIGSGNISLRLFHFHPISIFLLLYCRKLWRSLQG